MPIYGVGSKWEDEELKGRFFEEEKFILGWNEPTAKDIYSAVSTIKVGDILYIKANQPGTRRIRVKAVGIVTKNFMNCFNDGQFGDVNYSDWESLFIKVKWVYQDEFIINIPDNEGKLTNYRAATFYEEFLPLVQEKILEKIFNV